MKRLRDKVIVIVGGTTGIGFSAAKAFIVEGAKVVIVGLDDKNVGRAQEEVGSNGWVLAGDATDSAISQRAIERAREEFGGFDGLYHVAGGSGRKMGDGPLHELTDEGLEKTMALNFYSLVYSNRVAVRTFLQEGKGGCIINLGSVLGFSPSPTYFATHAYSAAKAAIIGFTRSIASYYARANIRVNVLAPGLVNTPMSARAIADEKIMQFIKSKQPLDGGRIGRPDDLDEAAVFLMSAGSHFVTGQVVAIDGGWSISEGS